MGTQKSLAINQIAFFPESFEPTAMADIDELAAISRVYVANIATGVTKPDAYICLVHSFFFIKSQVWV